MKGIPIKFRGKCIDDGKIYYGLPLYDDEDRLSILELEDEDYTVDIYPDSLRQLVGFDADGNEVYEDDFLVAEKHGVKYYGFATLRNSVDVLWSYNLPPANSYLGDDSHWRLSKESFESVMKR